MINSVAFFLSCFAPFRDIQIAYIAALSLKGSSEILQLNETFVKLSINKTVKKNFSRKTLLRNLLSTVSKSSIREEDGDDVGGAYE